MLTILLPPAPNTSPLCGEDEGANPVNERAEMVEARELLQVTNHHFNTAPLCGADDLFTIVNGIVNNRLPRMILALEHLEVYKRSIMAKQ